LDVNFYLLPLALAASPQSEEGEAVRLGGAMVWASRFALITREQGKVVSRTRYSVAELRAALSDLPEAVREQWDNLQRTHAPLQCGARTVRLDQPQVIGIVPVAPGSMADDGKFLDDPEVAADHAAAMLEAGAAMIGLGGDATRPGAAAVWEGDELKRVIPMVGRLAAMGAAISIDSRRPAVMEAALAAGAHLVNDVSALRHDPRSIELLVRAGVPVVLMHAPGDGSDLHGEGGYGDVVLDVFDWLGERRDAALAAGIARAHIVLDPGLGFGKSVAENLALLNALPLFHALGQPLTVTASRKRLIGALSNEAAAHQRLGGSILLAGKAMEAGVHLLRAHDVAETVQAVHVWRGLRDAALTDFSHLPM
jgi:dihydropteroate synthase